MECIVCFFLSNYYVGGQPPAKFGLLSAEVRRYVTSVNHARSFRDCGSSVEYEVGWNFGENWAGSFAMDFDRVDVQYTHFLNFYF